MRNVTVLFLLFISIQSVGQHGVSSQWSADVALPAPPASTDFRGVLYSNMGIFSNDKRVVVVHKEDGPGGFFYTFSYDGINWSSQQRFAPDTMVIGLHNLKMISDHNDTLHFIWASKIPRALYYSKMDSALNLIIDTVRISDNPDFDSFNDMYITTDLKDRIHVMWNEGEAGVDTPEIYYSQSTDGGNTWSVKAPLSVHDGIQSAFPRVQLNAYAGDTIAIAWRDSATVFTPSDWDIQMVVSVDGGKNWSYPPTTINASLNLQSDPDLVIDPQGRFHLFYHEAPINDLYWGVRVVYAYSDDLGQTWHSPGPDDFSPVSNNQRSYLVEGSRFDIQNGVLWTFWKEEDLPGLQGGDMVAAYSTDRGVTWSLPEYVTDRNDTSIGYKSVALLPNGGVGVNYELPNYPSQGKHWVFYKERMPLVSSVESQPVENDILIYPNPSSAIINIRSNTATINEVKIVNITGQTMWAQDVSDGRSSLSIDIGNFSAGVYFAYIKSGNQVSVHKFIKP